MIEGEEVGFITQAVCSPFLGGQTLGLAKIDRDRITVGQALTARVAGEDVAGEIVQHPTYEKERRKAKLG
jgi:glycine cleavage system aminomethyltransferase T